MSSSSSHHPTTPPSKEQVDTTVLKLIQNHYLALFPVILFQFLTSSALHGILSKSNPLVSGLINLAGTRSVMEHWYHRSVWLLLIAAPVLEWTKGYMLKEHLTRPSIRNPLIRHLVRDHFIINGVLVLTQFLMMYDFPVRVFFFFAFY